MTFKYKILIPVVGLIALFAGWMKFVARDADDFRVARKNIYFFDGVSGPQGKSVMPEVKPTSWQKYSTGSVSRLAILLTDEKSSWLGLAHGLKTIGVPFLITRDYRQAVRHRVVMVYPQTAEHSLNEEAENALTSFVNSGGTLIGVHVSARRLKNLFGFTDTLSGQKYFDFTFTENPNGFTNLADDYERTVSLGKKVIEREAPLPEPVMPGLSYTQPVETPLAYYADGNAAITHHRVGAGRAIAFGIDPGFLMLKSHGNRDDEIGRYYVNNFEPTLDMFLRLLKKIYEDSQPGSVTLGTVPFNRALTVLLTHDVDFTKSVQNSLDYAEYEKSQGIRATYFINAKYVKDYNDDAFLREENLPALKALLAMGMEIGSHSVSHSYIFRHQEPGTGEERYPDYVPFVKAREELHGGSVLGELRVSKFLLDHLLRTTVVSFRPGELSNPFCLSNALEATGFRFSSAVTANDSFTHLPFQLNYDRGYESESPIFEFPVTLEDEEMKDMLTWAPQGIAVAKKIARYGGLCNILIHPNVTDHKLAFVKKFVAEMKDLAWFDTLGDYGNWWAARNNIELDVTASGKSLEIRLGISQAIKGLTLQLPANARYQSAAPTNITISQTGNKLVIGEAAAGTHTITLGLKM